jgi:hypothetical protein
LTRADPLARLVFAVLVVACFAAFFVTQRLKHTPTAVQSFKLSPAFSPYPAGHVKVEAISFELGHVDAVTVAIVDSHEGVVATLVQGHRIPGYKRFSLRWNGRRGTADRFVTATSPGGRAILEPLNEGALAPPGEYRVRVTLSEQNRTVLSPRSFNLVGG